MLLIASPAWAPAPAPLYSRFVHDVRPDNVKPEHPRPQLQREADSWQSLNGLWQFDHAVPDLSAAHVAPPVGRVLPHEILVPYPVESALSGLRLQPQNFSMFYRRSFAPEALLPNCQGERLLHLEKSDWNTSVWADGQLLGTHLGGYDPFTFVLPPAAPTELIIGVYDATDRNPNHNQAFGKQQYSSFDAPSGMMYSPSSGLWDTVWAECVPATWISDVYAMPAPSEGRGTVRVRVDINGSEPAHACATSANLTRGGAVVARASASSAAHELVLEIEAAAAPARLWTPDDPFLYNLSVAISCGVGGDAVRSCVGLRQIGVGRRRADGRAVVTLNGAPVHPLGVLDQGWWPDGLYSAPTDAALRSDLQALKAMGFNAVRKHMKVESRRWFHHADTLGVLVLQDIPQQNMDYARFAEEVASAWRAHRSSPALVQWQLYNEGWGEGDPGQSNRTVELLAALETPPDDGRAAAQQQPPPPPPPPPQQQQRLIDDASGGRGFGCTAGWVDPDKCPPDSRCEAVFWTGGCRGDVVDHHHYPEPRVPFDLADLANAAGRPFLLGEYGGYSLPVAGHEWAPCDGGGTANVAAAITLRRPLPRARATALPDAGLTDTFVRYDRTAAGLLGKGLAGQIFTQISDVECERSGLLTYDRHAKANFSAVAAANAAVLRAARRLAEAGARAPSNRVVEAAMA